MIEYYQLTHNYVFAVRSSTLVCLNETPDALVSPQWSTVRLGRVVDSAPADRLLGGDVDAGRYDKAPITGASAWTRQRTSTLRTAATSLQYKIKPLSHRKDITGTMYVY